MLGMNLNLLRLRLSKLIISHGECEDISRTCDTFANRFSEKQKPSPNIMKRSFLIQIKPFRCWILKYSKIGVCHSRKSIFNSFLNSIFDIYLWPPCMKNCRNKKIEISKKRWDQGNYTQNLFRIFHWIQWCNK